MSVDKITGVLQVYLERNVLDHRTAGQSAYKALDRAVRESRADVRVIPHEETPWQDLGETAREEIRRAAMEDGIDLRGDGHRLSIYSTPTAKEFGRLKAALRGWHVVALCELSGGGVFGSFQPPSPVHFRSGRHL